MNLSAPISFELRYQVFGCVSFNGWNQTINAVETELTSQSGLVFKITYCMVAEFYIKFPAVIIFDTSSPVVKGSGVQSFFFVVAFSLYSYFLNFHKLKPYTCESRVMGKKGKKRWKNLKFVLSIFQYLVIY